MQSCNTASWSTQPGFSTPPFLSFPFSLSFSLSAPLFIQFTEFLSLNRTILCSFLKYVPNFESVIDRRVCGACFSLQQNLACKPGVSQHGSVKREKSHFLFSRCHSTTLLSVTCLCTSQNESLCAKRLVSGFWGLAVVWLPCCCAYRSASLCLYLCVRECVQVESELSLLLALYRNAKLTVAPTPGNLSFYHQARHF